MFNPEAIERVVAKPDAIHQPCNAITLNGDLEWYFDGFIIGFEPVGDDDVPHNTYKIVKHDPLEACTEKLPITRTLRAVAGIALRTLCDWTGFLC